jgi:tyrosyl-tRNA synthetase
VDQVTFQMPLLIVCTSILMRLRQRKIFAYAREYLPRLGYKARAHLMNAMVPGLQGGKMSASEANSKIDMLDTPQDIGNKIQSAKAAEGETEGNGLLAFAEAVLFPIASLRASNGLSASFTSSDAPEGTLFSIVREEQHGGPLHYSDYTALHDDYASRRLHPNDLKAGITNALTALLAPIRKEYEDDPSFQRVERLAYPAPKKEKEKKVRHCLFYLFSFLLQFLRALLIRIST